MHFLGRKKISQAKNFISLKNGSGTFINIWKHLFNDKILCLKKPHTLGAWNHQFSSNGGRDLWSHFEGRDLFFCVEPHIIIYFKNIKSFFNLHNLEPAPGRPAPLFLVLLPSILEQAPGCQMKILFDSREVYTDMRFHKKN